MSFVRIVFIVFATTAIAATAYVGYHGAGGESFDLDRSVRAGSGGTFVGGGRIK
ncbi:hypothetical protein [Thalassococcus lentus]|uniref:Uncharacterized protein n=1 Tax=Thalassococcus lentus TaxID=1210524 RepID=A0ABT4XVG2_9RHOB|nr:hypothetical protein [Thalassococcus lentus]MDA7425947.1 hypothetical protein [Thalassococcus lentus]